jgi:PelA/Pel-15E family pectate lyase
MKKIVVFWFLVVFLGIKQSSAMEENFEARAGSPRHEAENVLTWQAAEGGWPKNADTQKTAYVDDVKKLHATFDNGATVGEMRFLGKAFAETGDVRYRQGFLRGFDYILKSQNPAGGWPQSWPAKKDYTRHITFNDNAMVNVMWVLRDFSNLPDYHMEDAGETPATQFVDKQRQAAGRASFTRGIDCILKCQVRVNGKLTVWCAQHDENDYSPQPGRSFELVALSGGESAGILKLLMSIKEPSPAVVEAIEGGVRWFAAAKIKGIREVTVEGDKRIIEDANAPPMWARFYEIETNRPIFAGRDGVKKYHLAEIEAERRNGYAWYGYWGKAVFEDYARWKAVIKAGNQ